MNKTLVNDIVSASDATEHLIKKLPDLPLDVKVDIGARLRAVAKNCEAIDKAIKEDIKKKCKNKTGQVLGDVFKATLQVVPTDRCNVQRMKVDEPDLYAKYVETTDQLRVTFEPR